LVPDVGWGFGMEKGFANVWGRIGLKVTTAKGTLRRYGIEV
jgi:hypothetical protein